MARSRVGRGEIKLPMMLSTVKLWRNARLRDCSLACGLVATLVLLSASQVWAQQPTCAALPEVARSCVDVVLLEPTASNQARTGVSNFGVDDEPGSDTSGTNHVVRTLDTIIYEFRYRVLHTDAQALRLDVTLPMGVDLVEPPNPQFSGLPIPSFCLSGSTLIGRVLSCELGNVVAGTTRNATLRARPQFGLLDGTVLLVESSISAANQQSTGAVSRSGYQDLVNEQNVSCTVSRNGATVVLLPCGDVVSAKAQFDLELAGYATTNIADRGARNPNQINVALASSVTTVVGGSAGRSGFILTYPVAIALPGDGVGAAPLVSSAPIELTQRLSNSDGITSFGELIGCGINGNDDAIPNGTRLPANWSLGAINASSQRALYHPYGRIGLAAGAANVTNSVGDSGSMSCGQLVAGGDIAISLTPSATTFNPASFPTRQVDGQVVPRRYVFVGVVLVFYPALPVQPPSDGGTGDGSALVRVDLGVLDQGSLRALSIGGATEPDANAINNGFSGPETFDDDTNNFSIGSLNIEGAFHRKLWRNPRIDTAVFAGEECLPDGSDPECRHGYVFPGANIQSEFRFSYGGFSQRPNAQFCDEWDSTRTRLRSPFDGNAQVDEMPLGSPLVLRLFGLNTSAAVLNAAGFSVEVSPDAGSIPNIDWDYGEPARSQARSQLTAPECTSGSWFAAALPAQLTDGFNAILPPPAFESPVGSGIYPSIKRVRITATSLPAFISLALRGSYEVMANTPGAKLPNRTSFRFANESVWTYAENDHAIVRSVDTSINLTASRNMTTGALAPFSSVGYGELVEYAIGATFTSAEASPAPSASPVIIKAYLAPELEYVVGSANVALHMPPYAGVDPESAMTATVLEWRIANAVPGGPLPWIYYAAQLSANATNNARLHTSATIEHALDPSPLFVAPIWASREDRYAFADLVASIPEGLLVAKSTNTPYIESGATQQWTLQYRNTSASQFDAIRIIDVLPFNGDLVNADSRFSGGYTGGVVSPLLPGEYDIFYTASPSAQVNRNPNCVSNGGSISDGSATCPATGAIWVASTNGILPSGVTAIRVDDRNGLPANVAQGISLQLQTQGGQPGDVYENSFTAVAIGQTLVVSSVRANIRIPAGELRGFIYLDRDGSDALNRGDVGLAAVAVVLTGTDRVGNTYRITTASVALGTQVAINEVQINGGIPTRRICDAGSGMRAGQYLFCNLPTSGSDGYTIAETQPSGYLDGAETLGILQSGAASGVIAANDAFAGIRLTNSLFTGLGDVGSGYNFGERLVPEANPSPAAVPISTGALVSLALLLVVVVALVSRYSESKS
ncbi:MAG: hypothetical protein EAZ43_03155 [Betaproteobacteria bacterium]|nr:MAG: hypothetical protein EAZ43_03155 [Betaproteobacteria bacterium]